METIDDFESLGPMSEDTEKTSSPEAPMVSEQITLHVKNAVVTFETSSVLESFSDKKEVVNLPTDFRGSIVKKLENLPDGFKPTDSDTGRKWATVIRESLDLSPLEDGFQSTVENPEASFEQQVNAPAGPLMARVPSFKINEGQLLSGDKAVLGLMSHLNIGKMINVPLWHSGFWVMLRPASDIELLELQRLLISDKIAYGRYSYGLAFSNSVSYTSERLVSFVLDHVYQSSINTQKNLREFISSQDIPTLIWGMACATWPNGFQYRRACLNDAEKCTHVVEELLNLTKLQWTNTKGLTQRQIAHMSSIRSKSMPEDSVLRYQEDLLSSQNKSYDINYQGGIISMTLGVPKVNDYIDSGYRWINAMVETMERAFTEKDSAREREAFIQAQSKATTLRQFGHWVKAIKFGGNEVDPNNETIEKLLDILSSSDDTRDQIFGIIRSFIDDSCISIIGIPSYKCPKCQTKQEVELPNHDNIIPIDVYQTFFALLVQRLELVQTR